MLWLKFPIKKFLFWVYEVSTREFLLNADLKETTNDALGLNILVFLLVNIKKDVAWSFIGTAISASQTDLIRPMFSI